LKLQKEVSGNLSSFSQIINLRRSSHELCFGCKKERQNVGEFANTRKESGQYSLASGPQEVIQQFSSNLLIPVEGEPRKVRETWLLKI
jgi:hypothetical protein